MPGGSIYSHRKYLEPRGIEPLTSSMPLSYDDFTLVLLTCTLVYFRSVMR